MSRWTAGLMLTGSSVWLLPDVFLARRGSRSSLLPVGRLRRTVIPTRVLFGSVFRTRKAVLKLSLAGCLKPSFLKHELVFWKTRSIRLLSADPEPQIKIVRSDGVTTKEELSSDRKSREVHKGPSIILNDFERR